MFLEAMAAPRETPAVIRPGEAGTPLGSGLGGGESFCVDDDGSPQESACWQRIAELDLELAAVHVDRARELTRAVSFASAAGRADLAVGDVMGSLRLDRFSAERLLAESMHLVGRPAICAALESGTLGLPHARALLEVLSELPEPVADQVEERVLARCEGRPVARVRELARRAAIAVDPQGAADRRRAAVVKRYLSVRVAEDGMAFLGLLVRAETALQIVHRAEQATQADDGSGRTRDQRRADWLVGKVLDQPFGPADVPGSAASAPTRPPAPDGGPVENAAAHDSAPARAATGGEAQDPFGLEQRGVLVLDRQHRRPVQILVHVPISTALGLDDDVCELSEHGPIDADHGRLLMATAELRKVCVDAVTGQVLHVEDQVIRPVADPRRVAQLRRSMAEDHPPEDRPPEGRPPEGRAAEGRPAEGRRAGRRAGRRRLFDAAQAQAQAQAQAEAVRQALVEMVLEPSHAAPVPEPQYRPSASLSRTVKIAHPRCDFPCCSTPARSCDDEHTVAWPYGSTSQDNLRPRSRWCHRAKQRGWIPSLLPDGSTSWHAPSGRTYLDPPQHAPPPAVAAGAVLPPARPPGRRDTDPVERWARATDEYTAPLSVEGWTLSADGTAVCDNPRTAQTAEAAVMPAQPSYCCHRPDCPGPTVDPYHPGCLWREGKPPPPLEEPLPF